MSDEVLLKQYLDKLVNIRDAVGLVLKERVAGLYLFGRPGSGKTYTVKQCLDDGDPYHELKGGCTAGGFLMALEACATDEMDCHLLVDDCTDLMKSTDRAKQYVMSCTDGPGGSTRVIRYNSQKNSKIILFRRGVIFLSNLSLEDHDGELMRAVSDRMIAIQHTPTDLELMAFLKHTAAQGAKGLTKKECQEVAEFIPTVPDAEISLRSYFNKGLPIYRGWKNKETSGHWQDILAAVLKQKSVLPTKPTRVSDRLKQCARESWAEGKTPNERLRLWRDKTKAIGNPRDDRTAWRQWAKLGLT